MSKKTFILLISILMLASIAAVASSAAAASPIRLFLNDREVPMDVSPDIKDGVTVVPVRVVSENMGYLVNWNSGEVTISGQGKEIKLRINEKTAIVNGQPQELLRSAEIISDRTMVPLRFISEAMGAQVKWDSSKRQIRITQAATKSASQPLLDNSGNPYTNITLPPNLFDSVN